MILEDLALRELGTDTLGSDAEQAWALSTLAFGGEPGSTPPPARPGRRSYGLFDGDRLLAQASVLAYEQWWGGRRVPMAGVASVAVQPDVRGGGVARRLLTGLAPRLAEQGQVVSALFPTAVGLYRGLGWELAGALDETTLRTSELRDVPTPTGVTLRPAGMDDLPALQSLWQAYARSGNGLLAHDGPRFPRGVAGLLEADVVTLAVAASPGVSDTPAAGSGGAAHGISDDPAGSSGTAGVAGGTGVNGGTVLGYVAYDRGRGYGPGTQLRVRELVALTAPAAAALVRSLAAWDAVVEQVVWQGPVDDLGLLLRRAVPPPSESRPWMLRLLDVPAAIAARGYDAAVRLEVDLTLVGPDAPGGPSGQGSAWHLHVADGRGSLTPTVLRGTPPQLHTRGLALLYAAAADTSLLRRAGLLSGAVPGLDAAFAGPAAQLLDYF